MIVQMPQFVVRGKKRKVDYQGQIKQSLLGASLWEIQMPGLFLVLLPLTLILWTVFHRGLCVS